MMTEPFTADHYNRLLMNCFCRFACLKQRAKEVCCQTKKYYYCFDLKALREWPGNESTVYFMRKFSSVFAKNDECIQL